jgi:hypothetical protein
VWRWLSSDITAWARGCLACQWGKIHRYTRSAPQPIPISQRCFSHLHVDLVGPLQYSNNFNYIFSFSHNGFHVFVHWNNACQTIQNQLAEAFHSFRYNFCSLSLWRVVRGIKLTYLASRIHGLFIT